MKSLYMLDTNISSYVIKGTYPALRKKLLHVPMDKICISSITQAELLFGLAKNPQASKLKIAVHEFLLRVDIFDWDSDAAECYADLRKHLELKGTPLGAMDMLIAAHAISLNATLITNDQALFKLKHFLKVSDWTKD